MRQNYRHRSTEHQIDQQPLQAQRSQTVHALAGRNTVFNPFRDRHRFFHVIFNERLLCLVLILHFNAYLDHQNNQRRKDLYLALLWGLLGLFIKDTAVILFTVPAITVLLRTTITTLRSHHTVDARQLTKALKANTIECWLCVLGLAFCASYITLSLLPSSYANEGAYNQNATGGF